MLESGGISRRLVGCLKPKGHWEADLAKVVSAEDFSGMAYLEL